MPAEQSAEFKQAAKDVRNLKSKPNNSELLELYGLYKQGTQDPPFSESAKPGIMDFEGKAKRTAWEKLEKEGVTPEKAQETYIEKVNELKEKYGMA